MIGRRRTGLYRGTRETVQRIPDVLFVYVPSVVGVQWIKMQLIIAQKGAAEC